MFDAYDNLSNTSYDPFDEDDELFGSDLPDEVYEPSYFEPKALTPTELISHINESLEIGFAEIIVEGEVSSFKISQGKWVFFDLKDEKSSVNCFMSVWNLRMEIEDGMRVKITGTPKLTPWGKFSVTISSIIPSGEGSLKKAFELLKKKLTKEGLFAPEKKRKIPTDLTRLGVISSTGAAGYADFIKIINTRWGGMKVEVAHTQVQGAAAPDQIIRALKYFNERGTVQAIAILRGGGSADDLSCFNDELLVREIAASKIPIVTGIGHEIDESLADLAADLAASTPSNAAELLTPDRREKIHYVRNLVDRATQTLYQNIDYTLESLNSKTLALPQKILSEIRSYEGILREKVRPIVRKIQQDFYNHEKILREKMRLITVLNPEKVLKQGYAILSGKISPGSVVKITTFNNEINAEVKEVHERQK